jgi:LPS sulfotransferase NodH
MNLSKEISKRAAGIARNIYSILPFPGISSPVFIVGCGRSGTTILGNSLSKHGRITYLNEPRSSWFSAFPETDIWTSKARSRNGKLFLTEADVDIRRGRKLSRLFRLATIVKGRPILIEKLPINSFRLNLIQKIFPDARFVHIYRNGLEVARSIEKASEKGGWFGVSSYKWDLLVDYAWNSDETKNLPELCTTPYDKGLLEWRLSTEAAVGFLRRLPDAAFLEVNYDEFIDNPVETISKILVFIGVDRDPDVETFVSGNVARKSSRLDSEKVSEKEQMIGGALLQLSADGGKGLTRRCT